MSENDCEKKHEDTEPEVVELSDEQLEKIAGGQTLGLCYTCGEPIKRFPNGLEICLSCGALYRYPDKA